MRCLVLGANGFIGSNLVERLVSEGHKVTIYDQAVKVSGFSSVHRFFGDFKDENRWDDIVENNDVCFHLISTTTPAFENIDMASEINDNLVGTIRLLDALSKARIRLIFISSGGTVYGEATSLRIDELHPTNPLCSYGIIKLAIEKYIGLYQHLYGLNATIIRLSNPYGKCQSISKPQGAVTIFLSRILQNRTIDIWGDGSVVRDYIYISDVINALIRIMALNTKSTVFNIGSGIGTSLKDIVKQIETTTNIKARIVYHPSRRIDVLYNVLNIELAINELDWRPIVPLEKGIIQTMNWINSEVSEM